MTMVGSGVSAGALGSGVGVGSGVGSGVVTGVGSGAAVVFVIPADVPHPRRTSALSAQIIRFICFKYLYEENYTLFL
jgi:hypothetical protein